MRDEDLRRSRGAADARTDVDREAADLVADRLNLTGVHSGADLKLVRLHEHMSGTRVEGGRRRARVAKRAVALTAVAGFAVVLGLVRQGHPATGTSFAFVKNGLQMDLLADAITVLPLSDLAASL